MGQGRISRHPFKAAPSFPYTECKGAFYRNFDLVFELTQNCDHFQMNNSEVTQTYRFLVKIYWV